MTTPCDSIIISMIAAVGRNRELGANNDMLWHIPEDFAYFHRVTRGHPVIMGRATYQSLPESARPLPKRTNIVLMHPEERESFSAPPGVAVAHTLDEALAYGCDVARDSGVSEVFIIGGGSVYALAMPVAHRLYITEIDAEFPEATVFFPPYKTEFPRVMSTRSSHDENFSYTFNVLER